jgi:uncharacterized phiE125 gp8 family phage protein
MPLTIVTAPALDPLTIVEARAQCKIDDSEEDGLLAGYLLAARNYVETHTRRALITQTWDQTVDALCTEIVLKKPPVQSVTSVKYIDAAGVEQTLAPDQYRLVRRETGESVIVPAYGVSWPTPRDIEGAVTVRFVAGYGDAAGDVPEAIRLAMKLMVAHWYENREASGLANLQEIPLGVDPLLFPHRAF